MRAIHSKLWRELWQLRWQNLAIVLVMAAGVATVVMSISTLLSLNRTRADFYSQANFGQGFVHLKRAPLALLPRIRAIDGVAAAEARVVMMVTLDIPGLLEPGTGRLVSHPDRGLPLVNRLYLREGRMLGTRRSGEVLVSEAFARTHQLHPGSPLTAVINGKQQRLQVVGVVLSPEFVYSVRPGELLPDDRRFGVLWMGYEELSSAFDMHEAFNDVSVTLLPSAREAAVLAQLDELLAPYGGSNAYGRELQPSHRFLENELVQLRTMALVPPAIFLAVTIFLLQVVMTRQIAIQRELIAMLRAFGYLQREIAIHYLQYALVIGLVGSLLGTAIGAKFGVDLTIMYAEFFRFPVMQYRLDWWLVLLTAAVGVTAVLAGVWNAVWNAASLPPAQAMQPEAPRKYQRSLLERMGLQSWLPQIVRMILRQLERRPLRAFFSSLGIALSIAILVMGNFLEDTVDHVMDFQFFTTQRQDLMVSFVEPTTGQAARDLGKLPGVIVVEPFRAVPVRLVHRQNQRRLDLLGLTADAQLMRVVDPQRGPMPLPQSGLVISRRLAEVLQCRVGDIVKLEVLEGLRIASDVSIVAVIDDYLDLNAYIELATLRRLLREQDAISGAFLLADRNQMPELYRELKQTPRVAGISIKRAAIDSYQKTMAENLLRMKGINVLFACIVAIGVVYNCARVSLAERSRELATLRVLGFTRGETSWVLLGELAILVVAAIPWGLVVGHGFAWLLTAALNTEVHRFPLIIHGRTYAFAIVVVILAAMASALAVRRRMDHVNLVEVLKTRD
ncbi:FtsX-like permease family protein [Anatilimnocola aggregata]|uniref:FtsX-like permease family protein n=1 Tax=Anatilimnocola aggregata TaxID=2528021 RepID=A0A517YKA9_9BACT|nr:ABC transporter permease [Anatilimnocola aggregata]QDU30665.1 FtsX-like permease family protein [Anatilimnocola aggregata]